MDAGTGMGLQVSVAVGHGWYCGLFYGALGILLAYSLFFLVGTRTLPHLYYSVQVIACGLAFASVDSMGIQHLWPGLSVIADGFPLFLAVALWAALQLTRELLVLRDRRPQLDRVGRELARALVVLFVVVVLLAPSPLDLLVHAVTPAVAALLLAMALSCRTGNRQTAGLLALGWGVLLGGAILTVLGHAGVLPGGLPSMRIAQSLVLLVAVLLSLAQVDHLRQRRRTRELLQEQSCRQLQDSYRRLQEFDTDKLRFLAYLGQALDAPAGGRTGAADDENGRRHVTGLVDRALCYFDLAGESRRDLPVAAVMPMWLVDDVLRSRAQDVIRRRLRVHNRVPPELTLMACERQLRRILDALVDNVVRHAGDGSEVVVLGGEQGGDGWLTVRDDGRGLDPAQLGTLFEPFFTRDVAPGADAAGLGLAIARRLARAMGGELRASSSGSGGGAAFTLSLPAATTLSLPAATPVKNPVRPLRSPAA